MEIAKIIVEYLKILIWPIIILYIAIRYRKYFDRLFERFCEETEEISSTSLGITAKFRKAANNLSKISEKLPENQKEAKLVINNTRKELIKEQIIELSKNFFKLNIHGRRKNVKLISELATEVDIYFIFQLAKSESPGERIASGICLEIHLNMNEELLKDEKVSKTLEKGLEDVYSRVRYRYVRAILSHDELLNRFQKQLFKIAKSDKNKTVRELAQQRLDEI